MFSSKAELRDNQATIMIANQVANVFGQNISQLQSSSNSQMEFLAQQGEAIKKLLESKQAACEVLPSEMKSDFMSLQPLTLMSVPLQLTLSTPVPQPTPTEVLSAAPLPSSNKHIEQLISFFDEQPEDVTPKPVSSDVIFYLTKKFTKENNNFNQDKYRKRCRQAEFPYPKSLPKKVTAQQAKNLI